MIKENIKRMSEEEVQERIKTTKEMVKTFLIESYKLTKEMKRKGVIAEHDSESFRIIFSTMFETFKILVEVEEKDYENIEELQG